MSEKHKRSGSTFPPLKPGVIRLYSMKYCPYAQRARLVLAHKDLDYETINVHLKDKPDWFLQKNPLGAVPVVEVDEKIVYESTAVSEWIDDVYTNNRLQPSDSYRKAWDRILLEYFGKVGSVFITLLLKPEEVDKVAEELGKHYKFYEDILAKRGGPFFGGSAFPPTKPNVLRLYSMRFCPYAQRTRLVLAHKNIPYETVNIHLRDKPDWFWTKNPLGAVPVLEIDDKIVYESTATSEWLDDVYPKSRLQPSDPYRRAWDRILLEYFGKITTAFYGLLFKSGEPDKLAEDLGKHLKYYDDQLAKRGGPFFGGKSPSLIDFYIWPHLERVQALGTRDQRIFIDKARYPNLAQWFEAMRNVPAVKATSADTQTLLHFFDTAEAGTPDFDYGLE